MRILCNMSGSPVPLPWPATYLGRSAPEHVVIRMVDEHDETLQLTDLDGFNFWSGIDDMLDVQFLSEAEFMAAQGDQRVYETGVEL
jgi:hypothetical protein